MKSTGILRSLSWAAFFFINVAAMSNVQGQALARSAGCNKPRLSKHQQELLDTYLILRSSDSFLLSSRLGYSCEIRKKIGIWLRHEIAGSVQPEDQEFARRHRSIINDVVSKTWTAIAASPAVPSDGALPSEKWNILTDPAVDDKTVEALVSDDISKRGLWGEDTRLIFDRSLPGTRSLIEAIAIDPHADIVERLYAIALLTRMKPPEPPMRIPSIDSITQGVELTPAQKRTAELLRRRIQNSQSAEWLDVADLLEDEI